MLQLKQIYDPRDNLEKARRMELLRFAQQNGVSEIVEAMPAILMRQILRARGLTRIAASARPLGALEPEAPAPANIVTVDAVADLERQWKREQAQEAPPPPKRRGRPRKVKADGKDVA
jgi:hypothetical protein